MRHIDYPSRVSMTPEELFELPIYSMSLPTGTTIGKRWRRSCNDGWVMGEYVKSENQDSVAIKWYAIDVITIKQHAHLKATQLIGDMPWVIKLLGDDMVPDLIAQVATCLEEFANLVAKRLH